jgi:hypothetical protein
MIAVRLNCLYGSSPFYLIRHLDLIAICSYFVDFLIVVVPVELIVVIVSGDYIAVVVVVELCVDTEVMAQLAYFADNWTCYNNYCVVAVA